MSSLKQAIAILVKALLLSIIIPVAFLLGGCSVSLLYWSITQPARQTTISKLDAPYTIMMDNYTLFILTVETAAHDTRWELWRSDGTSEGTYLLKKGLTEGNDPIFTAFVRQGSLLLFLANGVEYNGDTHTGVKLWQTDGTAKGTTIVSDATGRPFAPENVVAEQNRVSFNTDEWVNAEFRCSRWSGTGATSATFRVQRIYTRISTRPCVERERQMEQLPPHCIKWKQGVAGDASVFMLEPCNDDSADSRDKVIIRVNEDHTATIERHSAAKITEVRTIP